MSKYKQARHRKAYNNYGNYHFKEGDIVLVDGELYEVLSPNSVSRCHYCRSLDGEEFAWIDVCDMKATTAREAVNENNKHTSENQDT